MRDFFEPLERHGFVSGYTVNEARISTASLEELGGVLSQLAEPSEWGDTPDEVEDEELPFTHAATISLSGSRSPCAYVECRQDSARELGQFAALYSDRVYIYNFLVTRFQRLRAGYYAEADQFRSRFADDLKVLLTLRSLIEGGVVMPVNPPAERCAYHTTYHLAEESFGDEAFRLLQQEEERLQKEFLDEVTVALAPGYSGGEAAAYHIGGPERLLEHGAKVQTLREIPEAIQEESAILDRVVNGSTVDLPTTLVRELGLHEAYARQLIAELGLEMYCSEMLGSSFLTERRLHLDILNGMTRSTTLRRRNRIALEHLTSIVPFVDELSPAELLHIRETENDAFIQFRQALNEAIDEYSSDTREFTDEDARQLYGDVLHPRLAELRERIVTARNSMLQSSARKAVAWLGGISFGLYAGALPPAIAGGAAIYGASEVIEELLEAGDAEEQARGHQMYFLWRVKKRSTAG